MKTCNGLVACDPFPQTSVVKTTGGLAFVAQKSELTPLKVRFFSDDGKGLVLGPGDTAYVRADRYVQPWALVRMRLSGDKDCPEFILVPLSEVVMYLTLGQTYRI